VVRILTDEWPDARAAQNDRYPGAVRYSHHIIAGRGRPVFMPSRVWTLSALSDHILRIIRIAQFVEAPVGDLKLFRRFPARRLLWARCRQTAA
jgi:hypothetical protein